MANDPVHSYLEARNQFDLANRNAETLISLIRQVGNVNWRELMVANCDGGFPAEIAMRQGTPTIDARAWPTGQQIADVLIAWHNANLAVRNMWEHVPKDLRGGLRPPNS